MKPIMMKRRIVPGLILVILISLASCSKNPENPGNLQVIFKSSNLPQGARKNANVTNVELLNVYVNIHEIKFKLDESEIEGVKDSSVSEPELEGPFPLNLMLDGNLVKNTFNLLNLPIAAYDKIQFKFKRDQQSVTNHPLYNRSIFLSGTINSIPFEMWSKNEEKVEIEFPDSSSFLIGSNLFNLYVDFHLNKILADLKILGLDKAVDGNKNGVIEIGPDDQDGNNALASQLFHYVKDSFDLDDDNDNANDSSNDD